MTRAYVALGSNLGDREAALRAARAGLEATASVAVVAVSWASILIRLCDAPSLGIAFLPADRALGVPADSLANGPCQRFR